LNSTHFFTSTDSSYYIGHIIIKITNKITRYFIRQKGAGIKYFRKYSFHDNFTLIFLYAG